MRPENGQAELNNPLLARALPTPLAPYDTCRSHTITKA